MPPIAVHYKTQPHRKVNQPTGERGERRRQTK